MIYAIGLLSYVYLVAVLDKRMGAGQAAGAYLRENAEDWVYVTLSSLAVVIPPLRRYVETRWGAAAPLEGYTTEEIEADEDAGGMGGGDGKLAAAIGANLGLSLALGSFGFAVFVGAAAGVIVIVRQRRRLGERVPNSLRPSHGAGCIAGPLLRPYAGLLVHADLLGSVRGRSDAAGPVRVLIGGKRNG